MRSLLGAVVVVLLVGSGCGSSGIDETPKGGSLPVTPQALAAVAAEHVGKPDSARADDDLAEEFSDGGVGVELRFGTDGEYDGDTLALAVGSGLAPKERDCAGFGDRVSGCTVIDGGVLAWEKQVPEEDPGVVYLVVAKGSAFVLVYYAGPDITGDPRKLDLPISVDDLREIATDPRVDLTTSQAALDSGDRLPHWRD